MLNFVFDMFLLHVEKAVVQVIVSVCFDAGCMVLTLTCSLSRSVLNSL